MTILTGPMTKYQSDLDKYSQIVKWQDMTFGKTK